MHGWLPTRKISIRTTAVAESVRGKRDPALEALRSLTVVAASNSSFLLFNRRINIHGFWVEA